MSGIESKRFDGTGGEYAPREIRPIGAAAFPASISSACPGHERFIASTAVSPPVALSMPPIKTTTPSGGNRRTGSRYLPAGHPAATPDATGRASSVPAGGKGAPGLSGFRERKRRGSPRRGPCGHDRKARANHVHRAPAPFTPPVPDLFGRARGRADPSAVMSGPQSGSSSAAS